MKRLIAFLLALFIVITPIGIFAQDPATPTDLINEIEYTEIADDDFGYIENLEPQVFLRMEPNQVAMYDEITLIAVLINFPENYFIEWQYSIDQEEWLIIEDEHELTYTFIVTPENYNLWYRVCVTI